MEPNPPDDPSARFRKPGDQDGAKFDAAYSTRYGLAAMLEDTLIAPVGLGSVFTKLAAGPAPSYGVMAANVAVYSAAFMAINVMRFNLTFPEFPTGFTPEKMALMAVVAIFILVSASFAGAGILHAAVSAAGGKGGYERSYQIYSLLSLFWPAVAASLTFHFAWLAVAAFWTYLAVIAAESLQGVPAAQARLVLGSLALAAAASVWYVSVEADKYLTPYVQEVRMAAQMTRQIRDAQAAMTFQQSLQGAPAAGVAASTAAQVGAADPVQQVQQLVLQAQQMMQQSGGPMSPPAATSSGLQVLPPAGQTTATTPTQGAEQLKQMTDTARQTELNALTQVMPMINNQAMLKNLSPQQAQQMQQISGALSQLQDNIKTGKPMSPAQITQFQQMGQTMLQNMQQMKNVPPAQGQPQPQALPPVPQGNQP
jgi:hypothetical protein